MMRLSAYVSGKVREVGHRARVVDIANAFGLKGMVENLKDGRVKIIAEGEDEKLKWFESAIDIKNSLIRVSYAKKQYYPAINEFDSFGKLVVKGETDARLDMAAGYLKELVFEVKNLNHNPSGKMEQMLDKQDQMLGKQIEERYGRGKGRPERKRNNLRGRADPVTCLNHEKIMALSYNEF